MRQILSLCFTLITVISLFGQENIKFNVQYSELYATYDFLTKISEYYPDNELKTIFNASVYNTANNKMQVSEFEQLRLDYMYAFDQYPPILKSGMMSRDVLERNLAVSKTINEFTDRSIGLLPDGDLNVLVSILKNFQYIYHTLFEANESKLEVQKNNLLKYKNSGLFSEYFLMGLTFYNTKWNTDVPFEICLLPSLDKGNLGARAFSNIAICDASLDLEDHVSFFSVTIHEICHVIYNNQSLQMKQNI